MKAHDGEPDVWRYLVARYPPQGDTSACPDANVIAALVGGHVARAERASIEEHLAACGECRGLVTELMRESSATIIVPRHPRLRIVLGLAIAAAVIAALLWIGLRGSRDARDTRAVLLAAASSLQREDPQAFAGFRILGDAELDREGPIVSRSGTPLACLPRGSSLSATPRFEWQPRHGRFEIVVEDASLQEVARFIALQAPADLPASFPLMSGASYTWRVTDLDAQPSLQSRDVAFAIASPSERAQIERALELIDAHVEAPMASLLKAHFALQHQLFDVAFAAATAFVAARPDDELGRATLAHLESHLALGTD